MKDSWLQSFLSQDQFQKIDRWIYELMKQTGQVGPLKNSDYCIIGRKHSPLKREVVFSPNCFEMLREIQPEFLSLDTNVIPMPESLDPRDGGKAFVFWFGNVHYFFKIFPPDTME